MEELKNLVSRLLEIRPNVAGKGLSDGNVTYIDSEYRYDISVNNFNEHRLNLIIRAHEDFEYFSCKLTEKEFMDIKWKIEAWEDKIRSDAFDAFKSFVNNHPQNSMDELLND